MTNKVEWVVVGKFGRVQGLKGFIKVVSFTEPKDNILSYSPLYANIADKITQLEISDVDKNNKLILIKVAGYEEREAVAHLTNNEILIHCDQLAILPDGEFYWHQLVGMEVFNDKQTHLGKVDDIIATGSNDVLVVTGEQRTLIPYIMNDYVTSIDITNNRITVNWDKDF
ncbi:MAG: 16S rRNA processing protein RimM [Legionellales bacterium RIFCSPHIGHO2_12_FULL_35_11]|nr:MAG: 16S rRNA processing protein RimM [Legionellales bacterium RIFCSPHIGHO2_12_FULL_35_11]